MTLPRLYGLNEYWRDHPPLHILIGAFLGIKPASKSEQKDSFDSLVNDLISAGVKGGIT